jgi:hypothetical protein
MGGTAAGSSGAGGAAGGGGGVATGGAAPSGGSSAGGLGGAEACEALGQVLWSSGDVNSRYDAGVGAVPTTIEHSLRVWYDAPNPGYCDELYGGQFGGDAARFFLENGETGTFSTPLDNLCNYSFTPPATSAVINPGDHRVPPPSFPEIITGACLHVIRNDVTEVGGRLSGIVFVTWELRGR